MKTFAIIAALAASIAAPAAAQSSSTAFAIAHFNQSVERTSDIVMLPSGANTTAVSTGGAGSLSTAFNILNQSIDSTGDLRGLNGATVVSGTPAHAQDIFARLRAASREDE